MVPTFAYTSIPRRKEEERNLLKSNSKLAEFSKRLIDTARGIDVSKNAIVCICCYNEKNAINLVKIDGEKLILISKTDKKNQIEDSISPLSFYSFFKDGVFVEKGLFDIEFKLDNETFRHVEKIVFEDNGQLNLYLRH